MANDQQTIFIVDDDEAVRDSLQMLLRSVGMQVAAYASAQEFLDAWTADQRGCLVLDIRMPGMSGLELQDKLVERRSTLPIVFISGHGDIPMAVQAIQRGAADFIQKPFRDQELLDRINHALEDEARDRATVTERKTIEQRLARLTPREREVMDLVVRGKANKVVAADLEVSQRTVEIHRARVMEKMGARSLAQLVRMVMQIGELGNQR